MDQLPNYGDIRQVAFCAFCGGPPQTRDHVPAKVFLDPPYPTNLPVVGACDSCNQDASLDEEYLACALECTVAGSARPEHVERPRIRRILERKPALVSAFEASLAGSGRSATLKVDVGRVERVILKLARGHALFWLNEPQLEDPSMLVFQPLESMAPEDLEEFETPPVTDILPEVGSRGMQWIVVDEPGASRWITAQPGRYRFLAAYADAVIVRFVIREYLACEVRWD